MTITLEAEAANCDTIHESLSAEMTAPKHAEVRSDYELTIINDAGRSRWIAVLGAEGIGSLTYRYVDDRVVLLNTWVDHNFRNHGVAQEMVAYALDEIKRRGKKITVICPFVGTFISRHPELVELIDAVHAGSGAHRPMQAYADLEAEIVEFEKDIH